MLLIEKNTRRRLLNELDYACCFSERLIGLIGRRTLPDGYGLYFPRCNAIHTCFMTLTIDIIYIDENWQVLKIVSELKPWRLSGCRKAAGVIETAPGWSKMHDIRPGTELEVIDKVKVDTLIPTG